MNTPGRRTPHNLKLLRRPLLHPSEPKIIEINGKCYKILKSNDPDMSNRIIQQPSPLLIPTGIPPGSPLIKCRKSEFREYLNAEVDFYIHMDTIFSAKTSTNLHSNPECTSNPSESAQKLDICY
jgi:hypothetical protein